MGGFLRGEKSAHPVNPHSPCPPPARIISFTIVNLLMHVSVDAGPHRRGTNVRRVAWRLAVDPWQKIPKRVLLDFFGKTKNRNVVAIRTG